MTLQNTADGGVMHSNPNVQQEYMSTNVDAIPEN